MGYEAMTHVPQIPQSDNPYELAMHAGNIRYHEQNSFNPKIEAIQAAGTVLCAEGLVFLFIIGFAGWLVMGGDYSQSSQPLRPSVLEHLSK